MQAPYRATIDTVVLPSYEPAPGLGVLPVNAFLIEAREPVLVDTGMGRDATELIAALRTVIDPADIRWIVLTHEENDHSGAFWPLLEEAPRARIAMNWVAMAKLQAQADLPLDRLHLVNPGQHIDVGDRALIATRPALFDSPATLAFFDTRSRAYFSADSFGGFVKDPVESLNDVGKDDFAESMLIFNSANHPWVHRLDADAFRRQLAEVEELGPTIVLGTHLPPAPGAVGWLVERLSGLPRRPEHVGPDQASLEEMLLHLAGAASR